jgi:DNA-binding NarL/FixJ family response regulator
MDVSMPHLSGIQAAIEIGKACPATLIMLVTALELSEKEVREAGVRGSLSKSALYRIADGIRSMLRGEEFHSMTARPDRSD